MIEDILNYFGIGNQRIKAIEELGELQQAIAKYIQGPYKENRSNVAQEIADVKIVLEQVEIGMGIKNEVEEFTKEKLKRTMERIERGYYKVEVQDDTV